MTPSAARARRRVLLERSLLLQARRSERTTATAQRRPAAAEGAPEAPERLAGTAP